MTRRSSPTSASKLVALLSLLAFATIDCSRPVPPSAMPHLVASVQPFLVYAPFYIAQQRGYFRAQGLDVEFVRLPSGGPEVAALGGGQVDVIAGRISVALLEALASGERLAAVADFYRVDPHGCTPGALLARRDLAGDRSLEALLGRRIEMDRAGIENFLLDRLLAPIGKSSADVDAVDLDDPAIGEAFDNGAIDFAFTSEPWSSRLVESGRAVVWRSLQEMAPDFELGTVLFGRRLLDLQPELGDRFLVAYRQAVADLDAGLDAETSAALAATFGLDPGEFATLCLPAVRPGAVPSDEGFEEFQRWALAGGLLDRPAPLARLFDSRPAAPR